MDINLFHRFWRQVKVQDLARAWLTNAGDMLKNLWDMDEETAEMIRSILKQLLHNIGRTAYMMIKEEQETIHQHMLGSREH